MCYITRMNIKQFREKFPDDDTCLDYLFNKKYDLKGYYRVNRRKTYQNSESKQISPLKGTIFEKSSTPLTLWFYAIYLFSVSKNGVSGKELERQLGVTYKCAWRMGHQIRKAMKEEHLFSGTVEVDETYVGGMGRRSTRRDGRGTTKQAVFGMVERESKRLKLKVIPNVSGSTLTREVRENVKEWSTIISDDFISYKWIKRSYRHYRINHSEGYWSYKDGEVQVHTNSIEGVWSIVKRSLKGTHIMVSKKYLQAYLDEYSFRYNHRENLFYRILGGV